MCQTLDISRSGYYDWDGGGPSEREKTTQKILDVLKDSHTKAEGMIGLDKMSRRGNCWDNAYAETFFSTIKLERLHHRICKNLEEARKDIFWYIECFYSRNRRHTALGNLIPAAFLRKHYKEAKVA